LSGADLGVDRVNFGGMIGADDVKFGGEMSWNKCEILID
jgi:hypothetical protein